MCAPCAGLERAPGTRVLVVDSHRPLHLQNTRADNEAVLVLRDSRERVPGRREEVFPEPPSDSEGDDSDADDGRENEGACRGVTVRWRRGSRAL